MPFLRRDKGAVQPPRENGKTAGVSRYGDSNEAHGFMLEKEDGECLTWNTTIVALNVEADIMAANRQNALFAGSKRVWTKQRQGSLTTA